ncbi:MAG: biotin synthase BioB, partial [Gammaproteobacteria bacterium]
ELIDQARAVHQHQFPDASVQMSTLLSIKTGACPEDCKYCSQSGHYHTGLEKEKLLSLDCVQAEAQKAVNLGASRFCMGAAWRSPPASAMPQLVDMIRMVKGMGLETCMTLGMLDADQTHVLREAGLDYYNHNLDTSPEHYEQVITTRTYQERLDTLDRVRAAGMKVCCGGILGLGENRRDRASMLQQLTNLSEHPESVPINMLVRVAGTPLEDVQSIEPFEFVRTIAVARIVMPMSRVRLSAGRTAMSDEMQAWCFYAGANSIFYGDSLLTTDNPQTQADLTLLSKLGLSFSATMTQAAEDKIPCRTLS